jgi:hypothetical protein
LDHPDATQQTVFEEIKQLINRRLTVSTFAFLPTVKLFRVSAGLPVGKNANVCLGKTFRGCKYTAVFVFIEHVLSSAENDIFLVQFTSLILICPLMS